MALTQYPAARGFIGVGAEATAGTAVAATAYVPILAESLARQPAVVLEKLLRQSRDVAFSPVLGEQTIQGTLSTPLYVDQGLPLLTAAIGADAYQTAGAAGASVGIGPSGAGLGAGSTALTVTSQTATPIAANDYVQIQQAAGSAGAANLAEVHKVQAVAGSGPFTLTLVAGESLRNSYTSAGVIARVPAGTAAFTHALLPDQPSAAAYKTLTIEKNLGGLLSLQFAGALVSKATLKATTKDALRLDYDIKALAEAQIAGSTPSYGTSAPLAPANLAVSLFGASDSSVASLELAVDQGGKEFWTFAGGNLPSLVAPLQRKITGKFTSIVQSITYYNSMTSGTTGQFVLTLTQGAAGIVVTLPKCVLTKLGVPLKLGDLLLYDAEFQALYSDSAGYSLLVQVTNTQWLPFI